MPCQIGSGLLHFDEATRFPYEVGECRSSRVIPPQPHLQRSARFSHTGVPEGPEETITEDLGFALLVTSQIRIPVLDELVQAGTQVIGSWIVHEGRLPLSRQETS